MILNGDLIKKIWDNSLVLHNEMNACSLYYEGKNSIPDLNKPRKDGITKSNARTNWTKYITDFHVGFNLANRVNYTTYSGDLPIKFANFYEQNNLHANDMENFSNAILYGYGIEVITYDGNNLKFKAHDPRHWAFVNDDKGNMNVAIYKTIIPKYTLFQNELLTDSITLYYVYTNENIVTYQLLNGEMKELLNEPNYIGTIPVIRYKVSKNGDTFITNSLRSQFDIYDVIGNSLADEIKYSVDSFLQLKGIAIDPLLVKDSLGISTLDYIQMLRLWSTPIDAEIKPIERHIDVNKFQYDLFTRSVSIHLMACVPDTLSERINGNGALTNLSGIALKILYARATQKSAEFRNYFIVGLRERLDLINRYASLVGDIPTATNVSIKIQPNMPQNYSEYMQYAPNMVGILPEKEILRQLPFIDDPDRVYKEWQTEQKNAAQVDVKKTDTNPGATNQNN